MKNNDDKKTTWLNKKSFTSAVLGALLALLGGIVYYNFERHQLAQDIAVQIKWEVYENITDTFDNVSSYDQAETFKKLTKLEPSSSIQDADFYYLTRHSLRDDFFKSRVGDFHLLEKQVMRDAQEFYSLLYSVDENERQLEGIFINKVPLKSSTASDIANDIAENTKKMRTVAAQVVGEIMYQYGIYDLNLKKKDEPELSSEDILQNLYNQVYKQVNSVKKNGLISAYEIASALDLFNPNIFSCDSPLDVCGLATSHYLIMKTNQVNKKLPAYNGHIKK